MSSVFWLAVKLHCQVLFQLHVPESECRTTIQMLFAQASPFYTVIPQVCGQKLPHKVFQLKNSTVTIHAVVSEPRRFVLTRRIISIIDIDIDFILVQLI
jgi:hypothetical protein